MLTSKMKLEDMPRAYMSGHVEALEWCQERLGEVAKECESMFDKTIVYRLQGEIKLSLDIHRMERARRERARRQGNGN